MRRTLLFPEPEGRPTDEGAGVACLSDTDTICGCLGVTKGTIVKAVHEKSIRTLKQLKRNVREPRPDAARAPRFMRDVAESGRARL